MSVTITDNGFTGIEYVLRTLADRLPDTFTLLDPETGIFMTFTRRDSKWFGVLSTRPDDRCGLYVGEHGQSIHLVWGNRPSETESGRLRWKPKSLKLVEAPAEWQSEIDELLLRNSTGWCNALAVSKLSSRFEKDRMLPGTPDNFETSLRSWLWFSCPAELRADVETEIRKWNSDEAKSLRAEAAM